MLVGAEGTAMKIVFGPALSPVGNRWAGPSPDSDSPEGSGLAGGDTGASESPEEAPDLFQEVREDFLEEEMCKLSYEGRVRWGEGHSWQRNVAYKGRE